MLTMAQNQYKVIDFCLAWKIEKFFSLFENCQAFESPSFNLSAFHSIYFTLAIEEHKRIVLTIQKKEELKLKLSESEISLSDTEEGELAFFTTVQEDANKWIFTSSKELSPEFKLDKLDRHLSLKCHMFFGELTVQSENNDFDNLDLLKLSRDIRKLSDCTKFCDIKLQAGNDIYNTHRAILFARSPQFFKKSVLITDSSNISHVTNIPPPVFELLMNYVYYSKLDISNFQIPSGLLKAVDQLELDNLKRKLCVYPNHIRLETRQCHSQTSFTWSVENISSMKPQSPRLMKFSPVFHSSYESFNQSEMSLEVVKLAGSTEDDIYFNVSLRYCFDQSSNVYFAKTKTSIVDIFGELQNSQEYQFQVDKSKPRSDVSTWVYRISQNDLEEDMEVLIPKDNLTFLFDLTIYKADYNIEGSAYEGDSFPDLSFDITDRRQLSLDLENLYNNKEYSDITYDAGDAVFKVHKIILFARAPKMLNADGILSSVVKLTDTDSNVLEVLFKYIYTGKLPKMTSGLAIRLYLAAYTYEIALLKQRCLNYVKNNLVF